MQRTLQAAFDVALVSFVTRCRCRVCLFTDALLLLAAATGAGVANVAVVARLALSTQIPRRALGKCLRVMGN